MIDIRKNVKIIKNFLFKMKYNFYFFLYFCILFCALSVPDDTFNEGSPSAAGQPKQTLKNFGKNPLIGSNEAGATNSKGKNKGRKIYSNEEKFILIDEFHKRKIGFKKNEKINTHSKVEQTVAKELDVSLRNIYKWKKELGLSKRVPHSHNYSKEEKIKCVQQFDKMKTEFKKNEQINTHSKVERTVAKELDVSLRNIYKWKKELGLSRELCYFNNYSKEQKLKLVEQFDKMKTEFKKNEEINTKNKVEEAIAKELGVSRHIINKSKKELGLSKGVHYSHNYSKEEKLKLVEQFEKIKTEFKKNETINTNGKIEKEILKEFSVGHFSIKKWKRELGLAKRIKTHSKDEILQLLLQFKKRLDEFGKNEIINTPHKIKKQILNELGIKSCTMSRWIKNYGLPEPSKTLPKHAESSGLYKDFMDEQLAKSCDNELFAESSRLNREEYIEELLEELSGGNKQVNVDQQIVEKSGLNKEVNVNQQSAETSGLNKGINVDQQISETSGLNKGINVDQQIVEKSGLNKEVDVDQQIIEKSGFNKEVNMDQQIIEKRGFNKEVNVDQQIVKPCSYGDELLAEACRPIRENDIDEQIVEPSAGHNMQGNFNKLIIDLFGDDIIEEGRLHNEEEMHEGLEEPNGIINESPQAKRRKYSGNESNGKFNQDSIQLPTSNSETMVIEEPIPTKDPSDHSDRVYKNSEKQSNAKNERKTQGRKIYSKEEKLKILKQFQKRRNEFEKTEKLNAYDKIEREIVKELGVSRTTIQNWKKEFGFAKGFTLYSKDEKLQKLSQFQKTKNFIVKNERIKNLHKLEHAIAKKLGVSRTSLYNWKKKFGLSMIQKTCKEVKGQLIGEKINNKINEEIGEKLDLSRTKNKKGTQELRSLGIDQLVPISINEGRYPKRSCSQKVQETTIEQTDLVQETTVKPTEKPTSLPYPVEEYLKDNEFAHDDQILQLPIREFTTEYIRKFGLVLPILFKELPEKLGMRMPNPKEFSILNVLDLVGDTRQIEVFDVYTQKGKNMRLKDFVEYFNQRPSKRKNLLNSLSLEFSDTKLSEMVTAPAFVRDIDWIDNVWPKELLARQKNLEQSAWARKNPC